MLGETNRTKRKRTRSSNPDGVWHGFVVLEPNTAVLEIKPGPYVAKEFADWAPKEGDLNAGRFVEWATNAAIGVNCER
jgi:hypothetical protein